MIGMGKEDDPEWLREKYVEEFLTAAEVAELTDVSEKTIVRRLKKHDIEVRTKGTRKKPIAKDKLRREYVEEGLSAREIAEGEDYSRRHVNQSLEHHDLDKRNKREAIWKKHGEEAKYLTHPRGHVMVSSGDRMAYLHQLLAIADGADPHDLFSGESVIHHKNNIPWDNRPENLKVFDSHSDHAKEHYYNGDMRIDGAPR